jgi:hypothetical protein
MTPTRLELRLAEMASAALASSMLLAVAFFVFFGAILLSSWPAALMTGAVLVMYSAQLYYLAQVKKSPVPRRLRIWQASLLSHLVVYGVAGGLVRDLTLVAVLLTAETISAICHFTAIVHLRRRKIAD